MLKKLKNGLIVSCYAGKDFNSEMADPVVMAHVAKSVEQGGACAVRTNLENVSYVKKVVDIPVIGIKKIAKNGFERGDFRITPTLKEVEQLIDAGADAIAIDGTERPRYDNLSLDEFIKEIKKRFDIYIIADVSTAQEGIKAIDYGADIIGTTLSGYTPYSKNPVKFGTVPSPEPDYEIIESLMQNGVKYVIAEGRYRKGEHICKAFKAGAMSVVVGTAITSPKKIVESLLFNVN